MTIFWIYYIFVLTDYNLIVFQEPFPYADEWTALRAQRQREYEQMLSLMRWEALMDITNEIAKDCNPAPQQQQQQQQSTFIPKSQGFSPMITGHSPNVSIFGKGRMWYNVCAKKVLYYTNNVFSSFNANVNILRIIQALNDWNLKNSITFLKL